MIATDGKGARYVSCHGCGEWVPQDTKMGSYESPVGGIYCRPECESHETQMFVDNDTPARPKQLPAGLRLAGEAEPVQATA